MDKRLAASTTFRDWEQRGRSTGEGEKNVERKLDINEGW